MDDVRHVYTLLSDEDEGAPLSITINEFYGDIVGEVLEQLGGIGADSTSDSTQPTYMATHISFNSNPVLMPVVSSSSFSKHYKMNKTVTDVNVAIVVKNTLSAVLELYRIFREGGSKAIEERSIVVVSVGKHTLYGIFTSLTEDIDSRIEMYRIFSLSMLCGETS